MRALPMSAMLVLALAACSTDPNSFTYHAIDAGHLMASAPVPDKAPDAATIDVRREPALGGWGLDWIFTVDGKQIVKLEMGEEFSYRLAPGQYNFGAYCPDPFGDIRNQSVVDVKPAQDYRVRLYATPATLCNIETTKVTIGAER